MKDLKFRGLRVGGGIPAGIGNRLGIVAVILLSIRNRGEGEGAGNTSF